MNIKITNNGSNNYWTADCFISTVSSPKTEKCKIYVIIKCLV